MNPLKPVRLKTWMQRLWWFDVVYPITVALLLFSSLTFVVYQGQKSSRLSNMGEERLLEASLLLGRGQEAMKRDAVLIVSADALDILKLGRAPLGVAPEPNADVFADVIKALAARGAKKIFVRWNVDAHPNNDAYYARLVETLRSLPPGIDVRIVTSSSMLDATPASFQSAAKFLEDDTCNYPERFNSDCPFNPEWPDWVMQDIIKEALPEMPADVRPAWATEQMPSIHSSYILNLPAADSIPTQSFSSVLAAAEAGHGGRPGVVFVGSDLSHAVARANNSSVARFVRTAYDDPKLDFTVAGTPLHVFWAMTSQMFHDHAMVVVPPEGAVLAMTIAFCVMVIVVMARFGGTAASGMFLVYVISGIALNAWAMRHLHVYAPLFDSFYFGLSTFLVAGFGRLSYTAFHRWRLNEQRRMHVYTADLKGNFISLLSHNLNTPVAKMQGMLQLLVHAPGDETWKTAARLAEFHVTQLEYAIRSVLVASALEEGSLAPQPRSLKAIVEELESTYGTSLRRLGVTLRVRLEGDDDLARVPLNFDVRAITAAVAGLTALFACEGRAVTVTLAAEADETDGDRRRLRLALSSTDHAPPAGALRILQDASPPTVRRLAGQSFFCDVLAGLGALAVSAYDGSAVAQAMAGGGGLEISFLEPSGEG